MTPSGSSQGHWQQRIERAERLSAKYPFASEFLDFYKHIASFQKSLHSNIAAAPGAAPGVAFASDFRAHLDLTMLLPHFRGFLSLVEQKAPSALGEAAHQMSLLPSESWIASLEAYWTHAGRDDQQVGAFDQFIPRAFLQPYAEFLAAQGQVPPAMGALRLCPFCGSLPLLGVLRPEGDGGKRFLLCSFCIREWEFRRILCPACGEETETKLPVYVAGQFPHIRVEACDTCNFYLKTIDLTKDGHAVPLVDDLASIPLSLWAHEHGYSRLQPNLLGT